MSRLTSGNNESFLYLFERPNEPLVIPKGEEQFVFDLPPDYVVDRYRPLIQELTDRFAGDTNENRIVIDRIPKIPDLRIPMQLARNECFSVFIPRHSHYASVLIEIFMKLPTRQELLTVAAFCRDRVNAYLFVYAYAVALQHRPDTRDIPIPSVAEIFPNNFFSKSAFSEVKEQGFAIPVEKRMPVIIPADFTATDLDEEHRVAYFREDIGINLHHYHWRLVYPVEGPIETVNKDRRGELFYYMHRQIIARYNFDRLCNMLPRVKRLLNWNEPIAEAYFPKLDSLIASRVWPSRHANAMMKDIDRPEHEIKIDVQDLELYRNRILKAIHTGRVRNTDGNDTLLTEIGGIDVLGNMIEASSLSVNPNYYGNLHNMGHLVIAYSHDPDNRHLESIGIMGDPSVAMRDPLFYRWHAFIDDLFQEHKDTLPRYTVEQLKYDGVSVQSVEVSVQGQEKNVLVTFWQQSNVDLSHGMDFTHRGSVYVRFRHLQHAPFTYKINVENTGAAKLGTVRIFLAPIYDERGVPFHIRDQRLFFIELDKFVHQLSPGVNTISRSSEDSSVTIPFEQTYRSLGSSKKLTGGALSAMNFCGCGWPDNMLIPKGSPQGFLCQLFVMVSDYEKDKVEDDLKQQDKRPCDEAASFCGIRDRKYPDKQSMGYPFDRQPRPGVATLEEFLTPNMAIKEIRISFRDRVIENPKTEDVQ